jgi:replicative DNA helicase
MSGQRDTYLLELRLLATTLKTGVFQSGLCVDDLNYQDHQTIYQHMLSCQQDLGALDYSTFGDWLQSTIGVDLRMWLADLEKEASIKPEIMPSYVDKLKEINASGQLRDTLERLPSLTAESPEALKAEAIRAIESVTTAAPIRRVRSLSSAMTAVMDEIDKRCTLGDIPGVPSGMPKLDEMTGGFQAGDLSVLAARPAAGKTALMLNFALHAARSGKRVGIFSAEQPTEQIAQRLLSTAGRVPAWYLRNPRRLTSEHWPRITRASTELRSLDIVINDDSSPSVERLLTYASGMAVDVIFVDYIQRLKAAKTLTIYERVSAVAIALKEMARECNVPVIALAQINRAGAAGARMEHLKGSGDIEQEADCVLILERDRDDEKKAVLALEKNRHGPTGEMPLVFNAAVLEFREQAFDRGTDDAY